MYRFVVSCLALSVLLIGCTPPWEPDRSTLIPPADRYDVEIVRDEWGVPHIFGKTDPDVAYGLAFAHCEDDTPTFKELLLMNRGRLATVQGVDGAPIDYMVQLFKCRERVAAQYESDLTPETRALCEAYAEGVNHYFALNPDPEVDAVLPVRGQDIVAGFVFKSPFFFGLDGKIQQLMKEERTMEVSAEKVASSENTAGWFSRGLPIGSNTFAVAPKRTPDGKTHLAINSHQPWTGPVAWYEAHLQSEESGWNMVGGVFPGVPLVLHGHNENLGWAHTVNSPDLVDIYLLEMNPDNENQYKYDGEWLDLEVGEAEMLVKLWGPISFNKKMEVLWSVHGPVLRRPHGVYAIRYAGQDDIGQVEQWYQMNLASNMEEFMTAMRTQRLASFNVGYGDKDGNIGYIYNARLPMRTAGYEWEKILPGNTSETLWDSYLPFDELPMVINPSSGFVVNCNGTPYITSAPGNNPREEDFDPNFGIETDMKNRGLRAMELFSADTKITEEEFYAYKYDLYYSKDSEIAECIRILLEGDTPEEPLLKEAFAVLEAWDLKTDKENVNAALPINAFEPVVRQKKEKTVENLQAALQKAAEDHMKHFGKLQVPWGEVNRLVRGETDLALGGGPDILHAIYGTVQEDGRRHGVAGDCYVLMATWEPDGSVRSKSIHQFGSASMVEDSKHYADQAGLFAATDLKPVTLDREAILAGAQVRYRPGESY